jgi:hypothetical protein
LPTKGSHTSAPAVRPDGVRSLRLDEAIHEGTVNAAQTGTGTSYGYDLGRRRLPQVAIVVACDGCIRAQPVGDDAHGPFPPSRGFAGRRGRPVTVIMLRPNGLDPQLDHDVYCGLSLSSQASVLHQRAPSPVTDRARSSRRDRRLPRATADQYGSAKPPLRSPRRHSRESCSSSEPPDTHRRQ